MHSTIDDFLNKFTLHRLTLCYLILLFLAAIVYAYFGILHYNPVSLIVSAAAIALMSWIANFVFAKTFEASSKIESVLITALILALITAPPKSANIFSDFSFLAWASVWAMASKYIIAFKKRHIFNPAAFAVALTALSIYQSAAWWASGLAMAPFIVLGGLLVAKKSGRFDVVVNFIVAAMISILWFSFLKGSDPVDIAGRVLINSPILFFAFVMITEPMTMPPTKMSRICYAWLVGLLFAPQVHFGSLYSTPEFALLLGNIFAYFARNILLGWPGRKANYAVASAFMFLLAAAAAATSGMIFRDGDKAAKPIPAAPFPPASGEELTPMLQSAPESGTKKPKPKPSVRLDDDLGDDDDD